MKKKHIDYDSPVDALVAVTKQLSRYEERYQMESEQFYDRYTKGQLTDSIDFTEWANAYQHYLELRSYIGHHMTDVA